MLKSAEIGASGPNNKETGDAEKTDLEKIDEAIDRKLRRIYKKINKTVNVILAGSSLVGIGWLAHDQVKNKSDDDRGPKILDVKADEPIVKKSGQDNTFNTESGTITEAETTVEIKGIDDGSYTVEGHWGTTERYKTGDAKEISERIGSNDPREIVIDASQQSEDWAGRLASMPEKLLPEELKGKNLQTVESFEKEPERIGENAPETYDKIRNDYVETARNNGRPAIVLASGSFDSHYEAFGRDDSERLTTEDALKEVSLDELSHENMHAVGSTGITKNNELLVAINWYDDEGNYLDHSIENASPIIGNGYTYDEKTHILTMPDGSTKQLKPNEPFEIDVEAIEGYKEGYCTQELFEIDAKKLGNLEIVVNDEADHHVTTSEKPRTTTTTTNTQPEPGTDPTSDWGKYGDPHAEAPGYEVTYSDWVDPGSEVTFYQNETTNWGNQGYIDDGGAAPGSSSSGEIIASGASNSEERLSGGEIQGGTAMNGESTTPAGDPSRDAAGDAAQKDGDGPHTDEQQVKSVADGDF